METILWIGLSQSLFAALLIAAKRDNTVSDKLLSSWLFLLAVSFISGGIAIKFFGYPLLSNSFLLFNPAFYLYIKSLIKKSFKLQWSQLLHLVPFIAFETTVLVLNVPLTFDSILTSSDERIFSVFFVVTSFLSWTVYLTLSIILVDRYRKNLKNELSNIESDTSLGWILFVLCFYIVLCCLMIILGIYSFFTGTKLILIHRVNFAALLAMVYIFGFYGLRQRRVFSESEQAEVKEKYKHSILSPSKKEEIKKHIVRFFDKEKPYLDCDFNMDKLSDRLKIPKHYLTEVLNTELQNNFFMFVNKYRVEAVKNRLKAKSDLYSIEAIGYDCGFSTKSSFFTTFKKITGQTPLQYKKSNHS
ncbi:MAG: AraC family transcriptional regulator [Bacteroidales bacterium]|nr:AraC family transcriptional regulator [Bacteroidales bacterium]